jgi:hypothetical protein
MCEIERTTVLRSGSRTPILSGGGNSEFSGELVWDSDNRGAALFGMVCRR